MKQHKDIQFLFEKAANEPVQISFDETQKTFTASLASKGTALKGFWAKKWILMITTALTVAIGAALWFVPTEQATYPKSPASTPKIAVEQNKQQSNDALPEFNAPSASKKKSHIIPDAQRLPIRPLEINRMMHLQPITLAAAYPIRRKSTREEPYRFPELTEEEKKANEKRKKEMVKNFVKLDKNSYHYIPSASFRIDTQKVSVQAFYIQKHEVTNLQYKTFLFDLLINDRKAEFLLAKPDQNKWVEHYGEGMLSMKNTYFSEDAYNNYPVVNVSRKGAEMYCSWLTQQIHLYTEKHGEPYFNDIRLPQRAEWIYAAAGGDTSMLYPIGRDSLTNENGCYLANFKPLPDNFHADGGFHTVKVDSYIPNVHGLYNMAGNVAEMVYENSLKNGLLSMGKKPGTAGGSWETGAEALEIIGDDPYSGIEEAHPAIGFRVVCTHLSSRTLQQPGM